VTLSETDHTSAWSARGKRENGYCERGTRETVLERCKEQEERKLCGRSEGVEEVEQENKEYESKWRKGKQAKKQKPKIKEEEREQKNIRENVEAGNDKAVSVRN
jgi:hypothetical protein